MLDVKERGYPLARITALRVAATFWSMQH